MSERLGVALALLNGGLLIVLIAGQVRSGSALQFTQPVLRGRALEIVDEQGRVRASISVFFFQAEDGIRDPETVLFRMTDPTSGPVVKLTAAANGSALGLSDDAN